MKTMRKSKIVKTVLMQHRQKLQLSFAILGMALFFRIPVAAALAPQEIAQIALRSTVLVKIIDANREESFGSGFVIGHGQIATNHHVIEGIVSGTVQLVGETREHQIQSVRIVDINRDLAIIQASNLIAPVLPLGHSDAIQIGQDVFAVGNPRGLTGTFSEGIVSAIRPEGNRSALGPIIQMTAPVSPGSSGGPLLNSDAEVVGIVFSRLIDGQNLNFAIPSNFLKTLITEMGRNRFVNIPDANLDNIIRGGLGKFVGDSIHVFEMESINWINASNSNIINLTGLEFATNLEYLDLGSEEIGGRFINSNSVSDLSPLSGLTNLTRLSLSRNSIPDLSALSALTNLTHLYLLHNSISDLSPLSGLTNLIHLSLSHNSISDISPLVANTGLGRDDIVWLNGNPLNSASINTHIPALQSRGVTVNFDPEEEIPVSSVSSTVPRSPSHSDLIAAGEAGNDSRVRELLFGAPDICVGLEFPRDTFATHGVSTASGDSDLLLVAHRSDGQGFVSLLLSGDRTLARQEIDLSWFRFVKRGNVWVVTHFTGGSRCAEPGRPDLVVERPTVSNRSLAPGEDFTLFATVENQGDGRSNSTTLRWYRSTDSRISTSDSEVGTDHINQLDPDESGSESIRLTAPVSLGTYYYGACVESVTDESRSNNNCSAAVSITVEQRPPEPTRLTLISGDNQTGLAGDPMSAPFVVEVRDQYGDPMEGIAVSFAVTAGGGSLSDTSVDTDANGMAQSLLTLGSDPGTNTVEVSIEGITETVIFNAVAELFEFDLLIPAGYSLIHVPLKVTAVDGMAKTLESIGDLYDALGGANAVNLLLTLDSQTQKWFPYVLSSDRGTPADRALTDDMGIFADMKVPKQVRLTGSPLGTNGSSTITLNQSYNLIGVPLKDSRLTHVSDLFTLEGIGGNVPVIVFTDNGEIKVVTPGGGADDMRLTGGQAFILDAQRVAFIAISGDAWTNTSSTGAAPRWSLGNRNRESTLVLALSGSIAQTGLKVEGLRVTVKNLSTGKAVAAVTAPDETDYQIAIVDIETQRAATIGDVLEISAQSPHPLIGVEPFEYTVTTEDVRQGWIQLPALIAYEIPSETQLLRNYPNPFNPETWIPYRLANDSDVLLSIYDINGALVRELDLGHQRAGYYTDRSRAAYWAGRNEWGERVASGVYFYQLRADDYSQMRKMLIVK